MRISDWSSDVCSSYLIPGDALERLVRETATDGLADPEPEPDDVDHDQEQGDDPQRAREDPDGLAEDAGAHDDDQQQHRGEQLGERSEESRVGKGVSTCRSRWTPYP